jgi:hypothetical protein
MTIWLSTRILIGQVTNHIRKHLWQCCYVLRRTNLIVKQEAKGSINIELQIRVYCPLSMYKTSSMACPIASGHEAQVYWSGHKYGTHVSDNMGAIALMKTPHLNERSKHIDICYHYVHDLRRNGRLQVIYIPTADMVADGITKPLQHVMFERFKNQLGIVAR